MADVEVMRLLEARHHDPFAVLGRHPGEGGNTLVRVFSPGTVEVRLPEIEARLLPACPRATASGGGSTAGAWPRPWIPTVFRRSWPRPTWPLSMRAPTGMRGGCSARTW